MKMIEGSQVRRVRPTIAGDRGKIMKTAPRLTAFCLLMGMAAAARAETSSDSVLRETGDELGMQAVVTCADKEARVRVLSVGSVITLQPRRLPQYVEFHLSGGFSAALDGSGEGAVVSLVKDGQPGPLVLGVLDTSSVCAKWGRYHGSTWVEIKPPAGLRIEFAAELGTSNWPFGCHEDNLGGGFIFYERSLTKRLTLSDSAQSATFTVEDVAGYKSREACRRAEL